MILIIYFLFNWLSIIKHKVYCNEKGFIYVKLKSDEYIPDIIPKLDVRIEVLRDENDLKKYWKNPEIQKTKEKFRYLLEKGCIAYLAVNGKEIANYNWICDLNVFHPELYLDQPLFQGKNIYFCFNGHTFSKYRRNGLFEYSTIHIFRDFAHKGKIFGLIHEDNIASRRSNEKVGFKKIGRLMQFQVLQMKLVSTFVSDDEGYPFGIAGNDDDRRS